MEYQNNWVRPKNIEDKAMVADYYSKYEAYEGEFKGEWYDVSVLYAYTTKKTYNDKKQEGLTVQSEILNLVVLLDKFNQYVTVQFWGSRRHRKGADFNAPWSEWSSNPVHIQDLLYLVGSQKGFDDLSDHYEFSTPYEDREVYPHLCGAKLKMIAVHYADFMSSKGKIYPNNKFALFNTDGRSALEMQMNETDKFDAKQTQKEFKSLYEAYTADDEEKEEEVKPAPEPAPKVETPKEPTGISADSEDDLPF